MQSQRVAIIPASFWQRRITQKFKIRQKTKADRPLRPTVSLITQNARDTMSKQENWRILQTLDRWVCHDHFLKMTDVWVSLPDRILCIFQRAWVMDDQNGWKIGVA
jgi:hypothetical protein